MPILKKELTKEDCIKWMKNREINPISNYKITFKGKIYKEIEKKCKEYKLQDVKINVEDIDYIKRKIFKEPITEYHCQDWFKNKYRNPFTNYGIQENSDKFKILSRECAKYEPKEEPKEKPKKEPKEPKKETKKAKVEDSKDSKESGLGARASR